ncbi:hypothetical protein NE237_019849 [Protea cynaroides]|uniref:Uncharacterized protein n=1 Tax=Protea cynaroides TaxID=273540 RepID=A0A9Q0H657_9MAGN|nr:hypothetical protein NE237_019849 [Protea cynaroides]
MKAFSNTKQPSSLTLEISPIFWLLGTHLTREQDKKCVTNLLVIMAALYNPPSVVAGTEHPTKGYLIRPYSFYFHTSHPWGKRARSASSPQALLCETSDNGSKRWYFYVAFL